MSLSRPVAVAVAAVFAVALATPAAAAPVAPIAAAPGVPGCQPEPSFDRTIPAPQGPPAATTLANGSVGFSVVGQDRHVYYVETDISVEFLAVSPLACYGGGAVDNPAVAEVSTGLAFVVKAPTGRLYETSVTAAAPAGTGWAIIPGAVAGGGPAVVAAPDGRLHAFVRGTNGALYTASRPQAGGAWTAFRSLGGAFLGTPAVALRPAGGFVAVVQAPTGDVWTRSSTSAGAWGAWTRLAGAAASSPSLTGGFRAGRLDLFVIGRTGGLYQSTYGAGRFGSFKKVDGFAFPTTRLAAAATPDGVIVYITETGSETVTAYTQYLPASGWSGYNQAPYTWPDGAPGSAPTARGSEKRPAVRAPLHR